MNIRFMEKTDIETPSVSSATDIFYLIRRQLHSVDWAYKALGAVLGIAKVLAVTNEDVLNAYIQRSPDFLEQLMCRSKVIYY